MEECKSLFEELYAVVAKSTNTKKLVRMGQDDMVAAEAEKVIVPFAQRLLYFFCKAKMDTLRRNLESLKTSLQVMLSVLNFAENITAKRESFQMSLITITVKLPANRDLCLKWQPSSLQRPPSFVRLSSPKSGWR